MKECSKIKFPEVSSKNIFQIEVKKNVRKKIKKFQKKKSKLFKQKIQYFQNRKSQKIYINRKTRKKIMKI